MPVIEPRKSLEPIVYDSVEYYAHQIEGIRELTKRTSFLLADDMGLGKSLQAITIFAIDVFKGWATSAIVVCPPTLKGNWLDEFEKFTRIPAIILEGTPAQRLKILGDFKTREGATAALTKLGDVAEVELRTLLRGELTTSQLATKHGVHQTMVGEWKRQAMEGLVTVFSGKSEAKEGIREEEVEKLHAKIGQLLVERDFLAKASGR